MIKRNETSSYHQGDTAITQLPDSEGTMMLLISPPTREDAIAVMSRVAGYSDALDLSIPTPQFNPHINGTEVVTLAYSRITPKQAKRICKYLSRSTSGNRQEFETKPILRDEGNRKLRACRE